MDVRKALTGNKKGISEFTLRIIGFIFTFFDCLFLTGLGRGWMMSMRWAAFPIFAYLLAEGYEKTSSRRLYLRRLALFTVVAEVPYDLMYFAQPVRWQSQSVMLTLLIGFICVWLIDIIRRKLDNLVVTILSIIGITWLGTEIAEYTHAYFFKYGIIIIVMFYVANHVPYKKLPEAALFIYLGFFISTETAFSLAIGGIMYEFPRQTFSLLALVFIWLYNGERGPNGIAYRLGFYLIYPVMMLILTLVRIIALR